MASQSAAWRLLALFVWLSAALALHQHRRVLAYLGPDDRGVVTEERRGAILPKVEAWRALDHAFCGTSPCRFLVCETTRERTWPSLCRADRTEESKAIQHLEDLAALAVATGRDLVLPNVSGSRYSIDRQFPFSLYRDVDGFARALNLSRVHTWDGFLAHAERRAAAGGRLLFEQIEIGSAAVSFKPHDISGIGHLAAARLDGKRGSAVSLPRNPLDAGRVALGFLKTVRAEVVLVTLDTMKRVLAPSPYRDPEQPLLVPYSAAAVAAAEAVLNRLGPTTVVHWRCAIPCVPALTTQPGSYHRHCTVRSLRCSLLTSQPVARLHAVRARGRQHHRVALAACARPSCVRLVH